MYKQSDNHQENLFDSTLMDELYKDANINLYNNDKPNCSMVINNMPVMNNNNSLLEIGNQPLSIKRKFDNEIQSDKNEFKGMIGEFTLTFNLTLFFIL